MAMLGGSWTMILPKGGVVGEGRSSIVEMCI